MALPIVKICQKNDVRGEGPQRWDLSVEWQWQILNRFIFHFLFSFGQQTSSLSLAFSLFGVRGEGKRCGSVIQPMYGSIRLHQIITTPQASTTQQQQQTSSSLFYFLVNTKDQLNLAVIQSGVQTHQPIHPGNAPQAQNHNKECILTWRISTIAPEA